VCGIAGFAHSRLSSLPVDDPETIQRMLGALVHRGPDAHGIAQRERVTLGHRRLSIIDLSGGAQPMSSTHDGGQLTVTFNGEIYNYLELNAELAALGFHATTRSDTETLLNAYAAWGEKCVDKFNGMFAFVIHDRRKGRLFGARDRLGKKPFYYVRTDSFFAFASEPKALLQHPAIRREIDPDAAARYFVYEFVPGRRAIFKDMRKLGAGERFTFSLDTGALSLETFWDIRFDRMQSNGSANESGWVEKIQTGLEAAVRRRLVSDVPLGVFLSGGIDSSAVAAVAVKLLKPQKVNTFAIGFSDKRFDESSHARRMATFLGTEHHEEQLGPQAALDILPRVVDYLDEPFADASILPCYLLSRFARQHVTVALGGDGGDELFAGYDTFKALPAVRIYNALIPHAIHRNVVLPLANRIPVVYGNFTVDFKIKQFLRGMKMPESERLWNWLGAFQPHQVMELLNPDLVSRLDGAALLHDSHQIHGNVEDLGMIARDSYMFARTYLTDGVMVKVDRATMACSLEARSPLLDPEFVDLAFSIPSRFKVRRNALKYIFKKALQDLVPEDILRRPKKGFGVPVGEWFRGPLRDALCDTLHERRLREGGLLRPEMVQRLIKEHLTGARDNRKSLWTLFMFEQWRERWLKHDIAAPVATELSKRPLKAGI
jgi:asparagine synthase (glutamine-hydrolysing)